MASKKSAKRPTKKASPTRQLIDRVIEAHAPKVSAANGEYLDAHAMKICGLDVAGVQAKHPDVAVLQKSPTTSRVLTGAVAARWGMGYNSLRAAAAGTYEIRPVNHPQYVEDRKRFARSAR